jgi:hypothetical protein
VITIGIDPGEQVSNPAGYAVIDFARPLEHAILACGVIPPPKGLAWEERVAAQVARVPPLLSRYSVAWVACEGAYLGKNPKVFEQLLCFGWEVRVMARQTGCPFTLVHPADQYRVRLTLPEAVTAPALVHLPEKVRPHALSAIAIAWHGAGLLARRYRPEIAQP